MSEVTVAVRDGCRWIGRGCASVAIALWNLGLVRRIPFRREDGFPLGERLDQPWLIVKLAVKEYDV